MAMERQTPCENNKKNNPPTYTKHTIACKKNIESCQVINKNPIYCFSFKELYALFISRLELHFRDGGPSISGMNYTALEDKLGYRFKNPDLLVQALTHPSTDSKPETRRTYERLEFLGDAILQLAVTQYLYHHMPQSPEGELTQLRARTVSRANLGKYGFILGLDKYIALGKGEERAGGRGKNSIIANTFESVFGAISLDSDYETAKAVALRVLHEALDSAASHPKEINPKGELQAILQDILPETPSYETEEKGQRDAENRFESRVFWHGHAIGSGHGASKRKAEVAAAAAALAAKAWLHITV